MRKLIRLSPTGIEYGDYAWNFASGCGNNLDGKCRSGGFNCWAYSICHRFKGHYPNGFKPTVYPDALFSPLYLEKPSRILCAFMGDLFWDCPEFNPSRSGDFGEDEHGLFTLKGRLFDTIEKCPQHTFLFLTKQPQNLPPWGPFPANCEVGVTATDHEKFCEAGLALEQVSASVKYLSVEPFLDWRPAPVDFVASRLNEIGIKWIIIGAQTQPFKPPQWAWVREIIETCDKAGVSVFLKDNLGLPRLSCEGATPFYKKHPSGTMELRQECIIFYTRGRKE